MTLSALGGENMEERSEAVRARVEAARARQTARYAALEGTSTNADVPGRWLLAHGGISQSARELLEKAATRLRFSARGYHRTLRVARPIADLDQCEEVRIQRSPKRFAIGTRSAQASYRAHR